MQVLKSKILLGFSVLTLGLTSCHDDVSFDQDTYDTLVQLSFPVQNIDPNHDWSTIGSATVSLTVNSETGTTFQVRIYEENPIGHQGALTKLGEGIVAGNETAAIRFSYRLAQPSAYVALFDPDNYMTVYPVTIKDGSASVVIQMPAPGEGTPVSQLQEKPLSFRYCFEDNFPEAGDYDFNDCVFTVTPQLDAQDAKKVTVTVSLDAVGTQKCISGAIRLVGITDAMLNGKQCTRHFTDAAYPYSDNQNIPDGDFTTSSDRHNGDNSSVVMLLFKDAHWSMNPVGTSNTAVKRVFYNTMKNPDETGENLPAKTATYVFYFKSADNAKKMLEQSVYDAFLITSNNGVPWEIHGVQNGRKGALVLHADIHTDYQRYTNAYVNPTTSKSGKYTWAVMVPATMRYPIEGQVIGGRNRDSNAIEGAYKKAGHSFAEWAENRKNATDWYLYPDADLVY